MCYIRKFSFSHIPQPYLYQQFINGINKSDNLHQFHLEQNKTPQTTETSQVYFAHQHGRNRTLLL